MIDTLATTEDLDAINIILNQKFDSVTLEDGILSFLSNGIVVGTIDISTDILNAASSANQSAIDAQQSATLALNLKNQCNDLFNSCNNAKNSAISAAEISVAAKDIVESDKIATSQYKNLALGYKNAAKISEDNAKISEDAAKESETIVLSNVQTAIDAKNLALDSEQNALASETNSHNSEVAALGYKNTSESQAVISTNKALEASGYATAAANSANAYYIYNVTLGVPLTAGNYYTLTTAIAAVPTGVKKLGLTITFATSATNWETYQFTGSSITTWSTLTNWQKVVDGAILTPTEKALAEVVNVLYNKIIALEDVIKNAIFDTLQVDTLTTVKAFNYNGASLILTGTTTPSVTPDFIGQVYIKTSATVAAYIATGITNSGDWKQTT